MDRLLKRGGLVAAFAAIYVVWGSTYLAVALGLKATIPFWIVLTNFTVPADRRPGRASLAGLVPGLIGVALIAWQRGSPGREPVDPMMVLLLLGSALSWAVGSVVSQRQGAAVPAIAFAAMQLLGGGLALLTISSVADDWGDVAIGDISWASWGALAYLTIAGSVVAFTAYIWLLDHVPAPLVATYTFVNPIIAVVLGWLFLGEHLSWQFLAGFVLVVGSIVAVWRTDRASQPREDDDRRQPAQQRVRHATAESGRGRTA